MSAVEESDELPPVDELQWAKEIFERLGHLKEELAYTEHSNKARIVLSIAKQAKKLKENILIFVHSIPTLVYLETKLKHKNFNVYVLRGSTHMKERQPLIDMFNRNTRAVFLISSKVW